MMTRRRLTSRSRLRMRLSISLYSTLLNSCRRRLVSTCPLLPGYLLPGYLLLRQYAPFATGILTASSARALYYRDIYCFVSTRPLLRVRLLAFWLACLFRSFFAMLKNSSSSSSLLHHSVLALCILHSGAAAQVPCSILLYLALPPRRTLPLL